MTDAFHVTIVPTGAGDGMDGLRIADIAFADMEAEAKIMSPARNCVRYRMSDKARRHRKPFPTVRMGFVERREQ